MPAPVWMTLLMGISPSLLGLGGLEARIAPALPAALTGRSRTAQIRDLQVNSSHPRNWLAVDVKEWRKRALKDELPELEWMAADPVGFLKVLENVYRRCIGYGPGERLPGVRLILAACAQGVRDRALAVRKPAVYLLKDLVSLLARDYAAGMSGLLSPELLDHVAHRGLCDPGTDLDERGWPLQPKGTLRLADRFDSILWALPKDLRNARLFDGGLVGLERLDAWLMHGPLDPNYGAKLVDQLLRSLGSLLSLGERLPPDALPRLIRFASDTEYERIPLERLLGLLRIASWRQEYVRPFIAAAAEDPNAADVVWGLFRRHLEEGGNHADRIQRALDETGAPYPYGAPKPPLLEGQHQA